MAGLLLFEKDTSTCKWTQIKRNVWFWRKKQYSIVFSTNFVSRICRGKILVYNIQYVI